MNEAEERRRRRQEATRRFDRLNLLIRALEKQGDAKGLCEARRASESALWDACMTSADLPDASWEDL